VTDEEEFGKSCPTPYGSLRLLDMPIGLLEMPSGESAFFDSPTMVTKAKGNSPQKFKKKNHSKSRKQLNNTLKHTWELLCIKHPDLPCQPYPPAKW